MPAMGAAPPLLTLRDLLELACESSCSEGFRSYPRRIPWHCDDAVKVQAKAETEAVPVRLLIQAGLRRSPSRTLSSFLLPRSPGSLAAVSRLTRSLSRRLVFWRRHSGDDDDDGDASDVDERDSLGLPSPVVSSCSASECAVESEADASDVPVLEAQVSGASDESEKPSSSGCTGSVHDGAADGDGLHKALDGDPAGSSMMEEKQQLSPVSVMDFPFYDDEGGGGGDERTDAGTCSPSSFQPDLERSSSAQELLHKIRRLDGLAQGVDPADLEPRFVASDDSGVSDDTHSQSNSSTSSTDHDSAATTPATLEGVDPVDPEPRLVASDLSEESEDTQAQSYSSVSTDDSAATTSTALSSDEQEQSTHGAEHEPNDHRRLLARLLNDDDKKPAVSIDTEPLLLDFFAEGLDRLSSFKLGPVLGTVKPTDERDESALVRAAREWVQGAGTQWGVEDVLFAGVAALADMDRERRWMCVGVEEREVGVVAEELVIDALVAELVDDLVVVRC